MGAISSKKRNGTFLIFCRSIGYETFRKHKRSTNRVQTLKLELINLYEYTFKRIELKGWGKRAEKDYHQIINDYAKEGWRFVQIFAPGVGSYGSPVYYELIFERKIDAG